MPTTPKYGFRTPTSADIADGPTQLLNLATDVETLLSSGAVDLSAGTIKVAAPAASDQAVNRDYVDVKIAGRVVVGPAASAPAAGGLPDGSLYAGT